MWAVRCMRRATARPRTFRCARRWYSGREDDKWARVHSWDPVRPIFPVDYTIPLYDPRSYPQPTAPEPQAEVELVAEFVCPKLDVEAVVTELHDSLFFQRKKDCVVCVFDKDTVSPQSAVEDSMFSVRVQPGEHTPTRRTRAKDLKLAARGFERDTFSCLEAFAVVFPFGGCVFFNTPEHVRFEFLNKIRQANMTTGGGPGGGGGWGGIGILGVENMTWGGDESRGSGSDWVDADFRVYHPKPERYTCVVRPSLRPSVDAYPVDPKTSLHGYSEFGQPQDLRGYDRYSYVPATAPADSKEDDETENTENEESWGGVHSVGPDRMVCASLPLNAVYIVAETMAQTMAMNHYDNVASRLFDAFEHDFRLMSVSPSLWERMGHAVAPPAHQQNSARGFYPLIDVPDGTPHSKTTPTSHKPPKTQENAAPMAFSERLRRMAVALTPYNRSSKSLNKLLATTNLIYMAVLSDVRLLDRPEIPWEHHEYESLYRLMQDEFDVKVRFRALEQKIDVLRGVCSFFQEERSNRYGHVLEWVIILLIMIEVWQGALHWYASSEEQFRLEEIADILTYLGSRDSTEDALDDVGEARTNHDLLAEIPPEVLAQVVEKVNKHRERNPSVRVRQAGQLDKVVKSQE